jgi:7-cyano-7-deazaguanine synthase
MKIVAVISGGLDSGVMLGRFQDQGHTVTALSVNYGQRHRRELDFARQLAAHYGVPWTLADLSALRPLFIGSSQTDDTIAVPHGHYAAESMKVTVVPNRNMLLLATAGALAMGSRADAVAFAAHAGDHTIYPDCREEFVVAMRRVLGLADWHQVDLLCPFLHRTKAEIVLQGARMAFPFALTYSCYEGEEDHCGRCGTCVERREAFALAGVSDPTVYAEVARV